MRPLPATPQLPPCYGIIPARYASSRFPGKPLADIMGKPMFWHVWSRASRCPDVKGVYLATDDDRIALAAQKLDVPYVMTAPDHPSGTDRVFEAATRLNLPQDAVIINIQGDEPLLGPAMLSALAGPFADESVRVTTIARPITEQEAASPDQVKVVTARNGDALYFSRSAIPFDRDRAGVQALGHVGLYAFRLEALAAFTGLEPSSLEKTEKLEQLRLLENNIPIRVVISEERSIGVDRPEDIRAVIDALNGNSAI